MLHAEAGQAGRGSEGTEGAPQPFSACCTGVLLHVSWTWLIVALPARNHGELVVDLMTGSAKLVLGWSLWDILHSSLLPMQPAWEPSNKKPMCSSFACQMHSQSSNLHTEQCTGKSFNKALSNVPACSSLKWFPGRPSSHHLLSCCCTQSYRVHFQ